MDKVRITKMRYTKVLHSLKEDYVVKLFASGLLSIWATLQNIFDTDAELVLLLVIAVIVDWVSGHIRAKKSGLAIVSFGWRQTCVKVIEYALFLAVLVGVSNVFGESGKEGWVAEMMNLARNIDYIGYFYLIMTELKSIAENLSGKKGKFTELYDFIKEKIGINAK